MKYLISAATDAGPKRLENQDSMLVKQANFKGEQLVLAVLCDGMGGLQRGEVASAAMIRGFQNWFDRKLLGLLLGEAMEKQIFNSWNEVIQSANQRLYQYGMERNLRIGTTVTAMLFWKRKYYIAHVGDSRAYELRKRLIQLTRDQTLVQREVDCGVLSREQARRDSRRNVLLQCVGASKTVKPVYRAGETFKEAVYLLCCDGFCHLLDEQELFEAFAPEKMTSESELTQTGEKMIRLNKDRGEQDNISVIAIRTRR